MFKPRRQGISVEPVTANGVRYEVFRGNFEPFGHNRGIVAAIDEATGNELWTLLVYETPVDPRWETDVQHVLISAFRLKDDGRILVVTNERGQNFEVDLSTRTVTARPTA